MCILFKKIFILCLFLKNVSPSKWVISFNLHLPTSFQLKFVCDSLWYQSAPCFAINLPKNFSFMIVFLFYQKMCILFKKKKLILCLFLKNVSPSKRVVICFILNNSLLSMVEGIAFYALYKSRVLIIPCKAEMTLVYL